MGSPGISALALVAVLLAGCGGSGDAHGGGSRTDAPEAGADSSARPAEVAADAVELMKGYRDVTYRGTVFMDGSGDTAVRARGEWVVTRRGSCRLTARTPDLGEVTFLRAGDDMYVTADERGWVGWLGYAGSDLSWLRGKWTKQPLEDGHVVGCELDSLLDHNGGWEDHENGTGDVRGVAVRTIRSGKFMGRRTTLFVAAVGEPRVMRIRATDYGDAYRGPARVDLVATDSGVRVTRPPAWDVLE